MSINWVTVVIVITCVGPQWATKLSTWVTVVLGLEMTEPLSLHQGAGEFGCRYGHFWCFIINKPSNIWTRPIPQAQSHPWAWPGCWGRPQPAHQVPAPPAARELDYEPWNWHGQVFLSSWVDLYTVSPFWREQFFNMNIFQRLKSLKKSRLWERYRNVEFMIEYCPLGPKIWQKAIQP